MSPSGLTHYKPPESITSSLLRNLPDAVPPTEELEALQAELKALRMKSLERVKKVGEDLKSLEESMRRMRDKEKAKAKANEKIKREQEFSPIPGDDDSRYSSSPYPTQRTGPGQVVNGRHAGDHPRKHFHEDGKKKKKRKREIEESESEAGAPLLVSNKVAKTIAASSPHPRPLAGPDFTVPSNTDHLPQRPVPAPPPAPGPSRPIDVKEDFSKLKPPPNQVPAQTFYSSVEPWIRSIKEEDVGFLECNAEEADLFVMSKLGKHYTEQWAEDDLAVYGGPMPGFTPTGYKGPGGGIMAPTPKWDPSQLADEELWTEDKGHGPLTERVISALLPIADSEWKGVKAAEDAMEGRPGGNGAAAAARKERMNVQDLETRIRDTMRAYGLIDEPPDFSEKVDDPIATALRHAQQQLKVVMLTNRKRRERLAEVARDRLGYQEYLELRDAIDKNIFNTYTKLQRKDSPKLEKKKKKFGKDNNTAASSSDVNAAAVGTISSLPPCPAALGLGPDERNHLLVSDHLKHLVDTRSNWVEQIGTVFEAKEKECPGRIWGIPQTSVFEGIDEEVKQMLTANPSMSLAESSQPSSAPPPPQPVENKGKRKARGYEMDVG
ncbi:histone acetyltransferases subunit 3-domain-containing protein [Pterulicium gracile]|uniref:Histone acetyltransferases subunit 3-domain-containing protein n=1 Tax=Pterulicium gracile TaxID=1884261 RepID=A0A5C3R3Q1_9AGAR|nr:histone acetyltransferases subunit 3-domain-containing protein [Pterula gracilis]